MLTYGFNISYILGKQYNNVFYELSYVKCATSGILYQNANVSNLHENNDEATMLAII